MPLPGQIRSGLVTPLFLAGPLLLLLPDFAFAQNTYPWPASGNVGIGISVASIPLDVRAGALPQIGVAGTTDYATLFASDTYGPALYWDPNKDMRLGKGGTGLYNSGGFVEYMRIQSSTGNVGIGTNNPQHLLHVAGTIGAEEVIVSQTGADYVFDPGYRLLPLTEVASYINEHHHLPNIPSASEMQQKGVSVGEIQAKLLAKIEELTLHMIESDGRLTRAEQQNNLLQEENRNLREQVREIRERAGQ